MSAESKHILQTAAQTPEPRASTAPVPVWLFVLLFGLLYWAMVYFDRDSGWFSPQVYSPYRSVADLQMYQPPTGGVDLARGKVVYENICALCHNNDGNGKPNQAPTLVGSEWVTGNPNRLVRIPLAGLAGPISVKGENWNLAMPAMGATLSDDDLAAVLTYIRQSWGNKASEVTTEQVKAIRTQVGNRTQPWSGDELKAFE
jgi:mono/diheme cytochrome c family protein